MATPSRTFVFDNRETTYTVWFRVNYTDPTSGQATTWNSGQFGQDVRSVTFSDQATNITVEGGVVGGNFFFNPPLGFSPQPNYKIIETFTFYKGPSSIWGKSMSVEGPF
jgi:hypothetical protein